MKTFIGIIKSNKMKNTVVVEIPRLLTHPLYKKTIRRSTRLKAHTTETIAVGTQVKIVETRPFSKDTQFKVSEVIKV